VSLFRLLALSVIGSLCCSVTAYGNAESCFEQFSYSICVEMKDGQKACGPKHVGNDFFIGKLREVFQHSSPVSQKLFCSLSEISVVDELVGAAGRYTAETETVELLKALFQDDTSIELLQIIGVYTYFEDDDNRYQMISAEQLADWEFIWMPTGELFYVVTHELGHHLASKHTLGSGFSCIYSPDGGNIYAAPFGQEIREIINIGGDVLPSDTAVSFYTWLNSSQFVSPYSIQSDDEDFAETFAYYEIFDQTTAFSQIVADGRELFSTRSSGYTESKAQKFAVLEYLIQAVLAGDESVGLSMVTCDLNLFND